MFEPAAATPGGVRRSGAFPRATVTDERLFSIMGEPILFQTNEPALLAAAEAAFGRYPPAAASAPPLVLQLFVGGPQPTAAPFRREPVHAWSHGHLFVLTAGAANMLTIDLERGYSFAYITPAAAQDLPFVRYTFVEAAAQAMLGRARDFVAIHAACVVKNGRAILLHGRAGLGKSTLTWACLHRGFQLLSEDVVQVKLSDPELRFWGMPWQLHLLPDSLRFFPELKAHQPQPQANGEWKIEIAVETFFPGATRPQAPAGAVVLLDRQPTEPNARLERLTPAAALEHFDVVWSWEGGWRDDFDARLKSLLERGVYRLYLGATPAESAAVLDTLFNV